MRGEGESHGSLRDFPARISLPAAYSDPISTSSGQTRCASCAPRTWTRSAYRRPRPLKSPRDMNVLDARSFPKMPTSTGASIHERPGIVEEKCRVGRATQGQNPTDPVVVFMHGQAAGKPTLFSPTQRLTSLDGTEACLEGRFDEPVHLLPVRPPYDRPQPERHGTTASRPPSRPANDPPRRRRACARRYGGR